MDTDTALGIGVICFLGVCCLYCVGCVIYTRDVTENEYNGNDSLLEV